MCGSMYCIAMPLTRPCRHACGRCRGPDPAAQSRLLVDRRSWHIQVSAPVRVVFEREDELDGLGAAGPGLEQGLEGLAELAQPGVGVLAWCARRPVDPVEHRGDLQDLAPGLEEVAVEDLHRFACVQHGSSSSAGERLSPRFPLRIRGKGLQDPISLIFPQRPARCNSARPRVTERLPGRSGCSWPRGGPASRSPDDRPVERPASARCAPVHSARHNR